MHINCDKVHQCRITKFCRIQANLWSILEIHRPKKTWSKVVEEDSRKLNITEDMAEDRKQLRQLISRPTPGMGTWDDKQMMTVMMMS